MNSSIEFDIELIKRYDLAGPRYTSYPTAVQFHNQFGETNIYKRLAIVIPVNDRYRCTCIYLFVAPFVITAPAIKSG